MTKHFIPIVLVSLFLFAVLQYNWAKKAPIVAAGHDFITGVKKSGNVKLFEQTINTTGIPNRIVQRDIVYQGSKNITRIRAIDLNVNGTGGYASIVQGGVGKKNVTLRLRASNPGNGYNFKVDIYGK